MRCHRCNGIMANEKFYGPGDPFSGWRCLLCGEILDPLIWENRTQCRKFVAVGQGGRPTGKNGEDEIHACPGGREVRGKISLQLPRVGSS